MKLTLAVIILSVFTCIGAGNQRSRSRVDSKVITWGTYDSVVADYQIIMFWVQYHNKSDSEIVILEKGSGKTSLMVTIRNGAQSLDLFRCSDINLHLPPHTSYFRFCAGGVSPILGKMNPSDEETFIELVADSIWAVKSDPVRTRIAKPESPKLFSFLRKMDSLYVVFPSNNFVEVNSSGRRISVRKELYDRCSPLREELTSIAGNDCQTGLCYVAKRNLISMFCVDQSPRSVGGTFAPNWPWIQNHSKCTAKAFKQNKPDKEICFHEDRDRNLLVKKLAGLTSVLSTQRWPYKFLAGPDTVLIGASSWLDGDAGEVFH